MLKESIGCSARRKINKYQFRAAADETFHYFYSSLILGSDFFSSSIYFYLQDYDNRPPPIKVVD